MLNGLVEFSAEYAWIQKQFLGEMALPYALTDEDGRLLWANQAFQSVLDEVRGSKKNLISLFPEITKTDLATDNETRTVHTSFGQHKFRLDIRPIFVSSSEEEENEAVVGRQKCLPFICLMRRRSCITDS